VSDSDRPPGGRRCGVLLHPTSLPHSAGCGTLGLEAHRWVELLARHRVGVWQLLPLAPTDGTGSPYSSPSGFALNPWLLDPDQLVEDGALAAEDLQGLPEGRHDRLDLEAAPLRAAALAERLLARWPQQNSEQRQDFECWRQQQAHWLVDHGRFMVLRQLHSQRPWWQWPAPMARRRPWVLARFDRRQEAALLRESLMQWHLDRQWQRLHRHAQSHGVELVGDLPFYVAHDSADVWSHRHLFSVRSDGSLSEQSGVPPDYFSTTGQLWGTPVYHWFWHRLSGFRWWMRRLERQLELVDRLRLDHFRALEAYWSVPGTDTTAETGHWRASPGQALLERLQQRRRGPLPLIAEDLGVITPTVEALRDRYGLPGMKILQFAFNGDQGNPYLPTNYVGTNWIVYTGTHDNATCIGWWQGLDEGQRHQVQAVLGEDVHAPGWQLLRLALNSGADLAIVPLQDLLLLDDRARFNTPGTISGNWQWRLQQPIDGLEDPFQGLEAFAAAAGRGGSRGGTAEG
jgi:4-alpha-glucanotransferase